MLDSAFDFERVKVRRRDISLVALIDVALFLLIFFMVAGSIEKFEIIPIDPPYAESGALLDEGHIVILIGKREEVIVGDELITLEELEAMVRRQLKLNPAKVVSVKADAAIPASRMIRVMDAVRRAGGTHLSIATQSQHPE